jgi:signal transduction histidine kinase
LSQPLTALWGSLELALRTELSAQESRAALEQAFELTDLAVNTIKSMRELADAARTDAPTKLLSLGDLVRATLGDWQELADARGIKTRFMASLEVMVAAPPDRLRELVSRLLCLVIRRSPENGKSWLCLSARGGAADLLIADHGPSPRPGEFGLPSPETPSLAHLFAEAAKNRSLEWAVVKVLAESLGGSLQVAPRQPQGCCFLLRLPLAKEKEQRP